MVFLMNMNKGSYQSELDNFFKSLYHLEVHERFVYKGSLSKARKKLKYEAFIEANDHMTQLYYKYFSTLTWHGFNLLAVDGSTLKVPNEPDIAKHFGVWKGDRGKPCPKARISQLFDVSSQITLDAIISPKSVGERELAASHFLKLMPNDLILLDRGYPAFWLFKLIVSMNADFCARVCCTKWKVVKKFYKSRLKEQIVKLYPTYLSTTKCREMGLDKDPIKVRLIRVELDSGETEILITSLKDTQKYRLDLFADLYNCRWPVEEDYKTVKCRLEVENFSGKSTLSVYQDFHAKLFSKNLTRIITNSVKKVVKIKSQKLKWSQQVNFTQALSKIRHTIVLLFTRSLETVTELVVKLQKIYTQTVESVRTGRKYQRNHRIKLKRFHFAYKSVC